MTDRPMDTRGKTICLPNLPGGDIIIIYFSEVDFFLTYLTLVSK